MSSLSRRLKNGRVSVRGLRFSWQVGREPTRPATAPARPAPTGGTGWKLHLGPGPGWQAPSPEWLTVDVDPERAQVVVDFNRFDRFDLPDASVSAIYGSHVFEHINPYYCQRLFDECHRVLAPGSPFRLITPHARRSVEQYVAGNADYPLFQRRRDRAKKQWGVDYTLFECMREDFISLSMQEQQLGVGALAHQNAWDLETLQAQLGRAGFDPGQVRESAFQGSAFSDFAFEGTYESEANQSDRSLYVEAVR